MSPVAPRYGGTCSATRTLVASNDETDHVAAKGLSSAGAEAWVAAESFSENCKKAAGGEPVSKDPDPPAPTRERGGGMELAL